MAHTPYGYKIKNGRAVLDKKQSEQVKNLFDEYISGASLEAAGKKIGIPKSHSALGFMVENDKYMGDDFYPAIVNEDTFLKAQKERERLKNRLGRTKNYFAEDKTDISPFWDIVFCKECGSVYRRY